MASGYLDQKLYRWITVANERAERLDLPPGLIEESVQCLKKHLGEEFLTQIFRNTEPLHMLGLRGQVLDRWLRGGAGVDDHVIQVLDLAAVITEFKDDPCLADKLDRLKRSGFWPSQFELAMAQRTKRTIWSGGRVRLSAETNTSFGDFVIDLNDESIVCECARLDFGEESEEQYRLVGDLYQYLGHRLKKSARPSCVKIRINAPLSPTSFTGTVQCAKAAFSCFDRKGAETRESKAEATVTVEPLTEQSERIPFRYIDGKVKDVVGTDWVTAQSLCYVNARDDDEAAAMYRAGADLAHNEYARVFIHWQRSPGDLDPYERIRSKIKKKKHQTKSGDGVLGRVIFIESQWNVEHFDAERLTEIIDHELSNSDNTIAVVIAERCASVHYRRWYRYFVSGLGASFVANENIRQFFARLYTYDRDFDPILNVRYRRSWNEAAERVKQHEAVWEQMNRKHESRL